METKHCKTCGIEIEVKTNRQYCSLGCKKSAPKNMVRILYECACDVPSNNGPAGKHNHHFDYDRPYEAIKLCPSCHKKEHARLRRVGAQPPYWINGRDNAGLSWNDIKIPFIKE